MKLLRRWFTLTLAGLVLAFLATLLTAWLGGLSARLDPALRTRAEAYLASHAARFTNQRYLTIIDYGKPAFAPRLWVIDLEAGSTRAYHVTHGIGSGLVWCARFGNEPGSYRSSLGVFRVGKRYEGAFGVSLRLHGLDPGVNDKAYERHIVMRPARFHAWRLGNLNLGWWQHTQGCPAVAPAVMAELATKLEGGMVLVVGG